MVFGVIKKIIGWFILILLAVGFISVITISEYWSAVIISFVICFLFVIGIYLAFGWEVKPINKIKLAFLIGAIAGAVYMIMK